ncbi:Alpha/beta hydrolase fold-1 [Armillaria borealis]|uniref:Alpha/beta hydrolase fold-1 n=1 Tax=Armillaria borealis TaxID=47425 RepID=A0AA39MYG3_9AGAR|nr:Alpha/beta hydrolase fold-1 [Armillaria borealis]
MTSLSSQSYVFDPRPSYPLVSTLKRYWKPSSPFHEDNDALTLIFAHGTGFHKEQWEPTIEDLFACIETRGGLKIREVWSIDASNHGDAAILNEEVLQWGYEETFRWEEYARSIHALLMGLGTGVDVDFTSRRLVGIGHSMGAVSLLLSLTFNPRPVFESLILVELMTMNQEQSRGPGTFLVSASSNRRDTWSSKEDAYAVMKRRKAWQVWDDRVLRLFVEHGLRSLPTMDYPDQVDGVTLKCSRKQEIACYRDSLGHSRAYRGMAYFVKLLPIHLIYGGIDDILPPEIKDDVINNACGGIENLASVSRVEGGGHLIVQTNPTGLAEKIWTALTSNTTVQARL